MGVRSHDVINHERCAGASVRRRMDQTKKQAISPHEMYPFVMFLFVTRLPNRNISLFLRFYVVRV